MRIIRSIHRTFERQAKIALIAINAPGELKRTTMLWILLHLQMDITNRNLFVILMLEHQYAVGNLQAGNIKRPTAIFRQIRQSIVPRRNGRVFIAHLFRLRRQLDHRPFQHDLLNVQLMTQQRHKRHIKAHIISTNQRLAGAWGSEGHSP